MTVYAAYCFSVNSGQRTSYCHLLFTKAWISLITALRSCPARPNAEYKNLQGEFRQSSIGSLSLFWCRTRSRMPHISSGGHQLVVDLRVAAKPHPFGLSSQGSWRPANAAFSTGIATLQHFQSISQPFEPSTPHEPSLPLHALPPLPRALPPTPHAQQPPSHVLL